MVSAGLQSKRREISLCMNRPIHRNESERQKRRFIPFEMTGGGCGRPTRTGVLAHERDCAAGQPGEWRRLRGKAKGGHDISCSYRRNVQGKSRSLTFVRDDRKKGKRGKAGPSLRSGWQKKRKRKRVSLIFGLLCHDPRKSN